VRSVPWRTNNYYGGYHTTPVALRGFVQSNIQRIPYSLLLFDSLRLSSRCRQLPNQNIVYEDAVRTAVSLPSICKTFFANTLIGQNAWSPYHRTTSQNLWSPYANTIFEDYKRLSIRKNFGKTSLVIYYASCYHWSSSIFISLKYWKSPRLSGLVEPSFSTRTCQSSYIAMGS